MKRRDLATLATLAFFCACSGASPRDSQNQPIQYNHSLHVEGEGMECAECHVYVATNARATIPNIEICGECHSDEPATDSPEEAKLIGYVDAGEKIPWRKVYHLEDHVYFSHRRHTTLGGIECSVCHGDVAEMTTPFESPAVEISMDRCIKCHEENSVTTDCVACHR